MPWVRIDENFPRHPKVAEVGPLGIALQVTALCYCNQYLTDGFLPRSVAKSLLDFEGLAFHSSGALFGSGCDVEWTHVVGDLIESGLWLEVDGGYQIHDYHEFQPSKAQVLAERGRKQAAGKAGGQASAKARATASAQAERQAESKPVPVPVPVPPTELEPENQSPNGLSEKSAHSRKLSKSEQIARHWLERYEPRFATGEYSLLDYYGSALEKSWKQAVEDEADPYSTGRAVLGAFLEAALERKPNPPEWGKLGKLAKSFGIESIVGLDAALAKDLDDWYPYARATCKKRIEEQARGP